MPAPKRSERNRQAIATDMESRTLRQRPARENMTQHNFRMSESDYRALEMHFLSLGLSIGAGIRMVLKQYMNTERIR